MTAADGLLAGKYRMIVELGRGGMATAYLAALLGPGGFAKLQVVKRIHPEYADQPEFLAMFLEEARLASRLDHPNIVQTNEVGSDGGEAYLAMEYLEGASLDALLRRAERRGGIPLPLHVSILADVLAGLHAAHELTDFSGKPLALVHRDVSPHNVLISFEGAVKLADFGIAKAADSDLHTSTGVVKGKVRYMSPEQLAAQPVDRRTDVWAVGVMLWRALAGRPLWPKGTTDAELHLRISRCDLPSLRAAAPDAPEPLVAACTRALAPLDERWPTAAAMREELLRWLEASSPRAAAGVGPFVADLFAERREEIRAAIKVCLASAPTSNVPALDRLVPSAASAPSRPPEEASRTAATARSRPSRSAARTRLALLAGGAGLVFGLAAVGFFVIPRGAVTASGAVGARTPACAVDDCCGHALCTRQLGAPARCPIPGGRCAPLMTEECSDLIGDATVDESILIGAILQRRVDGAAAPRSRDSLALALTEIQSASMGLPGLGSGARRPVAALVCEAGESTAASARHLVEVLRIPALVGPSTSAEAVELASRLLVPNGVAVICPNCGSPALTTLDDNGLVWRTIVGTDAEGRVQARALADLEPSLRSLARLGPGAPLRVALLAEREFVYAAPANLFATLARFNDGKDAVQNGEDFLRLDFDAHSDLAGIARQVAEQGPHVVVASGSAATVAPLLASIEDAARARRAAPPWYLLGSSTYSPETVELVRGRPALRGRLFGVVHTTPPDSVPFDNAFALRRRASYGEVVGDPGETVYDATYALVYAMATVREAPLTGARIAQGFSRLVPPATERIGVGPEDNAINRALGLLSKGRAIDLVGTSGSLDFDLGTGDVREDLWLLWCVSRGRGRPTGGADGLKIVELEGSFDARSRRFASNVECP